MYKILHDKLLDLLIETSVKVNDFVQDPIKTGITSVGSVTTGTVISETTNEFWTYTLQYSAWSVGIIAGVFAIIAGIQKQIDRYKEKHSISKYDDDDSFLDNKAIGKANRKNIRHDRNK